jgi:RNA-directed DNA polymerase
MRDIRGRKRLFVLEYDFSKYFDTISHDYVLSVLRSSFKISGREFEMVQRFLRNPAASGVANYTASVFETPDKGIPQGTSISLFLANVACYELDRKIELAGVTFARYADDTLILTDSYDKADTCAKLLLEHGTRSGTAVNFTKSSGISLLTPDPAPEVRSKQRIFYLGHELSSEGVSISPRSIRRIKARVSRIIYNNLLLQPKRGVFSPDRVDSVGVGFWDWDLVTCVNELRRYIYGAISESALNAALDRTGPIAMTRSAMSFYPTIDFAATSCLRKLDGWLVDSLLRAYKKRAALLVGIVPGLPIPTKDQLVTGAWYTYAVLNNETKLPSFFKSWAYVRKCTKVFGLGKFPAPLYGY